MIFVTNQIYLLGDYIKDCKCTKNLCHDYYYKIIELATFEEYAKEYPDKISLFKVNEFASAEEEAKLLNLRFYRVEPVPAKEVKIPVTIESM